MTIRARANPATSDCGSEPIHRSARKPGCAGTTHKLGSVLATARDIRRTPSGHRGEYQRTWTPASVSGPSTVVGACARLGAEGGAAGPVTPTP